MEGIDWLIVLLNSYVVNLYKKGMLVNDLVMDIIVFYNFRNIMLELKMVVDNVLLMVVDFK